MVNRSKARGTAAESAVVRWVRANGFPWAERLALAGAKDCGDISLVPGRACIIEVKSHKSAATGQPGPRVLAKWLAETETERLNANADVGLLVVKRAGTTNPGQWWTYLPTRDLLRLVGAPSPHNPGLDSWACMTLNSTLALLRAHGYGTPTEQQDGAA